jgi:hypothetical protein
MIIAIKQDPNYGVDELGNVYSIRFNRKLKGGLNNKGYLQIAMCKNGKCSTYLVHRLVYEAHVGVIPEGYTVDHIDRDITNNKVENLRVLTYKENSWNTAAKGYCWIEAIGKYKAEITADGKTISLGYHATEEGAHAVYLLGKKAYHSIDGVGVEEAKAQLAARPDGRRAPWTAEHKAKMSASQVARWAKSKAS